MESTKGAPIKIKCCIKGKHWERERKTKSQKTKTLNKQRQGVRNKDKETQRGHALGPDEDTDMLKHVAKEGACRAQH